MTRLGFSDLEVGGNAGATVPPGDPQHCGQNIEGLRGASSGPAPPGSRAPGSGERRRRADSCESGRDGVIDPCPCLPESRVAQSAAPSTVPARKAPTERQDFREFPGASRVSVPGRGGSSRRPKATTVRSTTSRAPICTPGVESGEGLRGWTRATCPRTAGIREGQVSGSLRRGGDLTGPRAAAGGTRHSFEGPVAVPCRGALSTTGC